MTFHDRIGQKPLTVDSLGSHVSLWRWAPGHSARCGDEMQVKLELILIFILQLCCQLQRLNSGCITSESSKTYQRSQWTNEPFSFLISNMFLFVALYHVVTPAYPSLRWSSTPSTTRLRSLRYGLGSALVSLPGKWGFVAARPKIDTQSRLLAGLGCSKWRLRVLMGKRRSVGSCMRKRCAWTKESVISNLTPEEPQNKPIISYHGVSMCSPIEIYTFLPRHGVPNARWDKAISWDLSQRAGQAWVGKMCGFMGWICINIDIDVIQYVCIYIYICNYYLHGM